MVGQLVAIELVKESVLEELQLDWVGVLVVGGSGLLVLLALGVVKRQKGGFLEAFLDVNRIIEPISQAFAQGRLARRNVSADDAY